mmetsp:Transcript_23420/g.41066  ORF Transcript_23420/g.41066 Transcript_23420/m.41066 type:complete len:210 (-) Transcript_23420:314-943(-)
MESFSEDFQNQLRNLMAWRRDVRRFRTDPVDEAVLMRCLDAFRLAPSVGLSEPWRVIRVSSDTARKSALENYRAANADALAGYSGAQAEKYSTLKLSGMSEAPEHIAVFCDESTNQGHGLGAGTMPEMRRYSVVGAINLMWLTARAQGLGMGWVSILDPVQLTQDLNVPKGWRLVSYLCIGWPETYSETPELETKGWDHRRSALRIESR